MLCQKCKINNANVKIIRNINGDIKEYYLCSSCAEGEGINHSAMSFKDIIPDSFFNILAPDPVSEKTCEKCGLTYRKFKENPRFGCENCFEEFKAVIPKMIKDIHGSLTHTGKVPKRGGREILIKKRIADLRTELNKAVAEENFELAAKLRDEIKGLEV